MRRLSGAIEQLDGELRDQRTLTGNLRDLRRINRWLGGIGLTRAAIDDVLRASAAWVRTDRPIRILDVGTGAADVPAALLASWRGPGRLEIVALDRRPEIIEAALADRPELGTTEGLHLVVGDGLNLELAEGAMDIALCSLVLHHLDPAEAARLLSEMARVSRLGIVVNDLSRGRLAWLGAWLLGHLLTRNAYTKSDAPLSVRRAYRLSEAVALIETAGLRVVGVRHGFFGHRWAIAAVAPARPSDA